MESALAQPVRLIEYPSDLSGCDSLQVGDRQLLYLRSQTDSTQFVVVLGFYAGQKEDVVTKDLIEPVHESGREEIACRLAPECGQAHIFFL
ncbi:MAG: hypothetical protein QXJ74_06735 [Nitrososphaera sp.]|uniref:hypothetical protein n=1 Tax=Nitrososphaera sp. TaxID=1971748 RepID=UPI0017F2243F|nr:hypothetical protein [Nitrososphaera sp.]NWG37276.1 hypothetical protein [Nitrososphaera sp.]